MQTLSLADHFSSPIMMTGTIVFIVAELLSIAIFFTVLIHYTRVVMKHRMLPSAIRHSVEGIPDIGAVMLLWTYIIFTIVITAGTVVLFLLQPHLY